MSLYTFKPDLDAANQRWQAFFAGDLIDRPPVVVTAPRTGQTIPPPLTYLDKLTGDIHTLLQRSLAIAGATFWGGEAVPAFYPSFGPDEISAFCGAELRWNDASPDTNWSEPCVEDWHAALPIRLQTGNSLLQRQLEIYSRAAMYFDGRILLVAPDLHTNMDLLSALRGPERLCLDTFDVPELLDAAMVDSRRIFQEFWQAINSAGMMPRDGYALENYGLYSREGSATLQCDFSIMLSPRMFRRWVLPALEEEAATVKHVVYHWDGPGALVHKEDLLACAGLHTLSFVPGDGRGNPVAWIPLLRELQERGKAVHVWGTPDECKTMHQALLPNRVFYCTQASTQAEAEALLEWFRLKT